MKKGVLDRFSFIGISVILISCFIYCILNLFVVHETLIQIEHNKPLNVAAQNSKSILTEQTENGFITDIVFPSSIFYTHAQIEIKSDIQQNVTIKLAGPKVTYKNTYRKYTIDYKNAYVNNEKFLSKHITTSFLRSFEYSSDKLTAAIIDYEFKTDFVLRNMSLAHFIGIIVILLIIIGYLVYNLRDKVKFPALLLSTLSSCFNSRDFTVLVLNGYKNIRREYKICFWINFLVLNIVYLYLNMNFLYGNHDWPVIRLDNPASYLFTGRFSISIINTLLEYKYLPVLNNCLAFLFLALTPIFLIKYWKLPVTKFNIIALSVILLLHPQLLGVIYFLHLSYAYMLAPLLIIIGLILSEKKNYKISVLSICILVFAIGDYNVCLNTIAIIYLGKMFIEYANENSFCELFKKYFRTISIILMSCFIYYLIIQYLRYEGILIEGYNNQLLKLNQILPRTITIFIDSFRHFYLTYPFVDLKYLIVLSLLFFPMVIIAVSETFKKKNVLYLLGTLFIFILLVFSSKITNCVTATNVSLEAYLYYFSLPYIYTCIIAYILNSQKMWSKNLLFLLLIPICSMSILRDFEYQKYWKIGLDGDKKIVSRVVERIEEQDEFKYDNTYNLLSVGYYNTFNSSYFLKKTTYSNHIINVNFIPVWRITDINYFMPQTHFKSGTVFSLSTSYEDIKNAFADIPHDKIMNLKPWPHKDSVLVYGDTIVVCWQEKELEYVKKALMEDK